MEGEAAVGRRGERREKRTEEGDRRAGVGRLPEAMLDNRIGCTTGSGASWAAGAKDSSTS